MLPRSQRPFRPVSFASARRSFLRVAPLLVSTALFSACAAEPQSQDPVSVAPTAPSAAPKSLPKPAPVKRVYAPSRKNCDRVDVYAAGEAAGTICAEDAAKEGLTVVDLSDAWTPRVFATDPETHEAPEYREKYLALANQRNSDLGLYGILPSLSVLFGRLADDKRTECDANVEREPLAQAEIAWAGAPDARSRAAVLRAAAKGPAMEAAQAELACSGFLKGKRKATNASTEGALELFRRRHFIVGQGLDGETLHALSLGGDELAFVGVLRGLRERVADAAGLVEDGSAVGIEEQVAGRDLDLSRFAPLSEAELSGEGAPDLVGAATDAAARALGWTSPAAATAFYESRGKSAVHELRVAVKLPAPPAYHSAMMDLRVEIDRGDVVYEMPGSAAKSKKHGSPRKPSFVVYAQSGDRSVALMRWSTTIGGWKKERTEDGSLALKYKQSDVGQRAWRQIIAAPAWMPPESTPETDLLREAKDGTLALKRDLIQPGYANAYGLVVILHEEAAIRRGKATWLDHGIRTHGSVDYRSIGRGTSHGCHRLFNQLALRLSGFLLQHRDHVTRGKTAANYKRTLEYNGQTVEVDVPTRGFRYDLDPPVAVRVLEGRIAGEAQKPVSLAVPLKGDSIKG